MNYAVRPMVSDDLSQVAQIEKESFPQPLSAQYFQRELVVNSIARYIVASEDDTILGYAGVWLIVGEIHIITIAVRPDRRRRGVGELLLIAVFDLALEHKARLITLEVRNSNTPARAMYQKYGFADVGIRRGSYMETGEDAVLMSAENIDSDAFQSHFQRLKQDYQAPH